MEVNADFFFVNELSALIVSVVIGTTVEQPTGGPCYCPRALLHAYWFWALLKYIRPDRFAFDQNHNYSTWPIILCCFYSVRPNKIWHQCRKTYSDYYSFEILSRFFFKCVTSYSKNIFSYLYISVTVLINVFILIGLTNKFH